MNLHPVSACIAALFAFASTAQATSFMITPFPDFVKAAPNIVRGTLHDILVENGITADGSKTIYTYATVDVRETLKGSISVPTIRVRKLGGTRDGVTLDVPSSPEFVESEDTVVFLSEAREDQSYEVWGMELGKFWLKEEGGEAILQGGILEYSQEHSDPNSPDSDHALRENRKNWTLTQLRELAAASDRGIKAAAPSAVPPKPASPEAKDAAQANDPFTDSKTIAPQASSVAEPSHSFQPAWPYTLAGVIAIGIFLFFRKRG
jgi:hypothetical protein